MCKTSQMTCSDDSCFGRSELYVQYGDIILMGIPRKSSFRIPVDREGTEENQNVPQTKSNLIVVNQP